MSIEVSDIGMFLTGGSSNTNPNLSLGGNVSSTQVVSNNLHNLFRRITDSEASSGVTLYRCVAIKNRDATAEMRNVVLYMVSDTKSVDSLGLYSKAQAGRNTVETAVANEFTAPTGSNINFIAVLNRSGGIKLGDLDVGEFINVWLRYTVNPGASPFPNDAWKVRVEVDSTGTAPDPVPQPDPDTGVNFQMVATCDGGCGSTASNMWTRMKNRTPEFALFPGDLAYTDGGGCWLTMTSSFRSKSVISFGNHDVDEDEDQPETKNAYINAYSFLQGKTYGKKTFNNVGIVVMESGENQSVSDSVGSSQYNFVKSALEGYKANSAIEWIFVLNHYPLYGPSSNHSNNSGGRDRYDPLFDANGVDVVFTGHNHNLWHSKLLKYNSGSPSNPTTAGTDPNYSYRKTASNHGKIYVDVGAGGRSHYGIDSTPSYVVWDNDSTYGYLFMDFTNSGKKITFKFYSSSDSLLKTFTLTHTV